MDPLPSATKNTSKTLTTAALLSSDQLAKRNCSEFNAYDVCTCHVRQRIQNETTYVKIMSITRSNDLLRDNITEFTNVYLNQRLLDLLETIENINITLRKVNRAVPELIPVCM